LESLSVCGSMPLIVCWACSRLVALDSVRPLPVIYRRDGTRTITEFYAQEFTWWAQRVLGEVGPPDRLNVADSTAQRDKILPSLRAAIEVHHARDMELYRRALALRRERAAG
jgi:hypothetical protein